MTTCFSIARGDKEKIIPNYFDIPTEAATSLDLQDVFQVLKKDMIIRYNKTAYMYDDIEKTECESIRVFREKIKREIEKGLPSVLYYSASSKYTDIDTDNEFNYLLSVLQIQHSYVCKLVMDNLYKIKKQVEKYDTATTNANANACNVSRYDYSYIVNLLWSYRYIYAVKIFRERMAILSDTSDSSGDDSGNDSEA